MSYNIKEVEIREACKHPEVETSLAPPNFIYEGKIIGESPDSWLQCKLCHKIFPSLHSDISSDKENI